MVKWKSDDVAIEVVEKMIKNGDIPEDLREYAIVTMKSDLRAAVGRRIRRVADLTDLAFTLGRVMA